MMKSKLKWLATSLLCISSTQAVELAFPYQDYMVIQRDAKVPVWGTADAGATVKVSFAGQNVSTKADDQGKWN